MFSFSLLGSFALMKDKEDHGFLRKILDNLYVFLLLHLLRIHVKMKNVKELTSVWIDPFILKPLQKCPLLWNNEYVRVKRT
jgi:hypothetical protein